MINKELKLKIETRVVGFLSVKNDHNIVLAYNYQLIMKLKTKQFQFLQRAEILPTSRIDKIDNSSTLQQEHSMFLLDLESN